MKQKRGKKTDIPDPTSESEHISNIIVVDEDEPKSTNDNSKASLKRSWVWNHFKESQTTSEAVCQVILKNCICGLVLKKDWSGSTKKFHEHLLKVHKLVDPKSSKKIEKAQTNIAKWIKNAKLVPKVSTPLTSFFFSHVTDSY